MAITATDRGTGTHNSSSSSFNVIAPSGGSGGLSGTMAAGSTAALVMAMDNAAAANISASSFTDSAGNIWFVELDRASGTADANSEEALLVSNLTANLTTSDTLTITLTNAKTAKCWAFVEMAPSAGNTVLLSFASSPTGTTNTTTPTIATNSTVTGTFVLGYGGAEREDQWTGASSPWSTAQKIGVGSGLTGQTVITQTQAFAGPYGGPGSYNPTITTISDVRLGYAYFYETSDKGLAINTTTASEAACSVLVRRPLAAGAIGVLFLTADNTNTAGAAGNFPSSGTDTKSNTWTRRQNASVAPGGVINSGSEIGIYTSVLTTPLVPGDTITCTYAVANVTNRMSGVWGFAPTGAGAMSYVTGGTGTSGTGSTSPTITTSSIASGDYVIGVSGAELAGDATADADTTNGSWSTQLNTGTGTTTISSQSLSSQWKKVTSAGAQTYNPTLSASCDNVTGWIEINDTSTPPGGLTAAQKAAFFQMF